MTAFQPIARVTFTPSLNALEVVKNGNADTLNAAGKPAMALASIAITDNVIGVMLELAAAAIAAVAGDLEPARAAMRDLRLDELEIR